VRRRRMALHRGLGRVLKPRGASRHQPSVPCDACPATASVHRSERLDRGNNVQNSERLRDVGTREAGSFCRPGRTEEKREGEVSVAVTEAHYAHLLKDDLVAASQQVRIPVAPREGGMSCEARSRRGPA
jgi:hypothetical protein